MSSLFELREASHIDFVNEKRQMDILLETPPHPSLETSRTFFYSAEALRVYLSADLRTE